MTFPSGQVISTANVDSVDDDPSLARVDIYNLITAFNQLVASENAAQGVLVLDSSGKIAGTFLPTTLTTASGQLQLQPANGVVNVRNVLRLAQITTTDLGGVSGTIDPVAGDLCYLLDGDAGQPCLGVYNGANWKIVRFATTVGDVGAELSSEFAITAEADL